MADATSVSRARYPVPDPLARILKEVLQESKHEKATEPMETALAQLLGNSFQAMDSMYFGT